MKTLLYDFTSGALLLFIFLVITNSKKINKKGNGWLAFFLISIFPLIADESFGSNQVYNQFPEIIGFDNLFLFVSAPALYFCVLYYVSVKRTFSRKDLWHFVPAFLFFPIALLSIFESSTSKLQTLATETEISGGQGADLFLILLFFQISVYIILSYLKLMKHRQSIRFFSSNTEIIDLNWLLYFVKALGMMLVCWISNSLFPAPFFTYFSAIVYFLGIFFLAYHSLQQKEIYPFTEPAKQELKEIIEEEETRLAKKQLRLTSLELENEKAKLQEQMELKKYYLEDSLSLPKLAEYTQNTPHNLSYIINEGFSENFFQFVNRYRVEEAKRLLLSSETVKLNMLGIAYESGFNSKTTFNTTFKKMTGVSPTEFVKNNS
jgi:AraC-like DNA-binding protein